MRNEVGKLGQDLCAGKEYSRGNFKQKSKVNFRENSDLTNQHWEKIWQQIRTDKVFDFDDAFLEQFPDAGFVAGLCIDMLLAVVAHYLQSNIVVFDALTKDVRMIDGNTFLNGNVTNYVPFLVGHSRSHYQVLVPDIQNVPNAEQLILDYSYRCSDRNQIDQAKEY